MVAENANYGDEQSRLSLWRKRGAVKVTTDDFMHTALLAR
tara:strand:+ start:26986 stop:27105 length:120 start_codon:yes stop_codon:yes gene_type:complete